MKCPRAYCTSGLCARLTPTERDKLKAIATRYMAAGDELRGRAYDGATLLVEDGEANIAYNLRTKRTEIIPTRI